MYTQKRKEKMVKFEDIANANKEIKTTDIKGKDYAEVNQRIKAFRMAYPNGSITTEIVSLENGVVTMKSTVKDEEDKILATGFAYEKENSTFINKTSFIENCETSAVGRALGMCGFGIDTSVASYEEVANAVENQKEKKEPKKTNKEKLIAYCRANNLILGDVARQYGLNGQVSEERFAEVLKEMGAE